jgi:hypothetical protein
MLPAAACCCLLLPAAACCCLLLPAAACCCLLQVKQYLKAGTVKLPEELEEEAKLGGGAAAAAADKPAQAKAQQDVMAFI